MTDAWREWNGRPVVFGDFNIRQGREVREAWAADGERGSYLCLALSLRYADSNELVFQSVDDVLDQPFKLQQRVIRLAGEAARANGLIDDEPKTGSGKPNGAEPPGPSL